MTSPSDEAWIGCSIPAEKGRYFVQLVTAGPLFERKVLASSFGVSHEDALEKAMTVAGVSEVKGHATLGTIPTAHPSTLMDRMTGLAKKPGLLAAVERCEFELGSLANGIGRIVGSARKGDRLDEMADRADNLDALGESRQGELFG